MRKVSSTTADNESYEAWNMKFNEHLDHDLSCLSTCRLHCFHIYSIARDRLTQMIERLLPTSGIQRKLFATPLKPRPSV